MTLASGIGAALSDIVGREHVHVAPNVTSRYGCRQFGLIHAVPDVVVFPGSTTEVAEVLRGAYACGIPVVQRLATRYLSGGMIVLTGGIVLALDRMNRIIESAATTLETGWARYLGISNAGRIGPIAIGTSFPVTLELTHLGAGRFRVRSDIGEFEQVSPPRGSVGARQPECVGGDVVQDHLPADWRDLE